MRSKLFNPEVAPDKEARWPEPSEEGLSANTEWLRAIAIIATFAIAAFVGVALCGLSYVIGW